MVSQETVMALSGMAGASSIPLSRRYLDGRWEGIKQLRMFGKPSSLLGLAGGGGALLLGLLGGRGKGPVTSETGRTAAISAGAPAFAEALLAAIIEQLEPTTPPPAEAAGRPAPLPRARGPVKRWL